MKAINSIKKKSLVFFLGRVDWWMKWLKSCSLHWRISFFKLRDGWLLVVGPAHPSFTQINSSLIPSLLKFKSTSFSSLLVHQWKAKELQWKFMNELEWNAAAAEGPPAHNQPIEQEEEVNWIQSIVGRLSRLGHNWWINLIQQREKRREKKQTKGKPINPQSIHIHFSKRNERELMSWLGCAACWMGQRSLINFICSTNSINQLTPFNCATFSSFIQLIIHSIKERQKVVFLCGIDECWMARQLISLIPLVHQWR